MTEQRTNCSKGERNEVTNAIRMDGGKEGRKEKNDDMKERITGKNEEMVERVNKEMKLRRRKGMCD